MSVRELKDARIRYIMRLMVTNSFGDPGQTIRALAGEWNLSLDYVSHMCAEASRRIQNAAGDAEVIRRMLLQRLESISAECAGDGDRKHALKAIELQAKIHGLLIERRQNVPVAEKMTPHELRERLRAALAEVDAEIANGSGDVVRDVVAPATSVVEKGPRS